MFKDILKCSEKKISLSAIPENDYYKLALYYEENEDYEKAYDYYLKYTLHNTDKDGNACLLTKANLLKDNFTFSDELETQLLRSYGEYDLGLRTERIYEAIANYVVAVHYGKEEEAQKYKKKIFTIIKGNDLRFLDVFLKKDDIHDVLKLPKITKEFINSLKGDEK